MVCRFLFFGFCFFCLQASVFSHAFYVSVCNVYELENKLYFSIRLFKNDVFDGLKIKENVLKNRKEKERVLDYISDSFVVSFDNKTQVLVLETIAYEGENYTETINLKYSVGFKKNINKIQIKNRLLCDFFDDQINVVYFKANNIKKTLTYNTSLIDNWIQMN